MKAAIYIRKNSLDTEDRTKSKIAACREKIKTERVCLIKNGVFIDEENDSKQLDRLIETIKSRMIRCLIVPSIWSLGRDAKSIEGVLGELHRLGVVVYTILSTGDGESRSASVDFSLFRAQMLKIQHEMYREYVRSRIRRGIQKKRERLTAIWEGVSIEDLYL